MTNDVHHPAWKPRFIVGIAMLFLALLGLVFTDLKMDGAWIYWRLMTPVYALMSIGLSMYLHKMKLRAAAWTIWHEILHWLGLVLSVYVVSLLVSMGFISRYLAGVEVILLLALTTFLAGVYIESAFLVIGVLLGLLVAGIGFLNQYLYSILLPAVMIAFFVIFFIVRRKKKHPQEPV